MPKQKITKEMVVEAAFSLAKEQGLENVTVRDIASELNCSVQPVYSYCKNMDGLRQDVMERSNLFIKKYISEHLDRNDFFRSSGHAYIQLAKEEPNVFKMYVMSVRKDVDSLGAFYESETNPRMANYISDTLGISVAKARALHMNMLIYTMGIGTILINATPGIPEAEIHAQLELAYQAFLKQVVKKV